MNLNEFSNWNEPEYIESCNSIISHGNCKDVEFCIKCPFHWHNLTKEFADCTEYSDTNDCVLQDSKLVQSAKEFLELVEFQKRVESTTAKDVIEESNYKKFSKIISTVMNPTSFNEKEEEYIIMDDEYEIIHRTKTLKEAEECVEEYILNQFSNKEYIIAKIIKRAKLEKKVVWSE